LKLLVGGSTSKFFHLKEFCSALEQFGIDCKLVVDNEIYDGFPSRRVMNWFQTRKKFNEIVKSFRPDAVFIDRQRHFGLAAIKEHLPLFVHLRGDFWTEMNWARQTLYKSFPKRIALSRWEKIATKCFENSKLLIPICNYLENITKMHYPQKKTIVMHQGITPSNWYPVHAISLKHPCVGLLQGANIWGKTKEMLTLTKTIESMPNVTFYWVGDGPFRNEILPKLNKFPNFKWLGQMQYPERVREYLSEIDVYALASGIDMSPLTLQEAQLMEKPVLATNVGGVPELMKNNQTGYLIEKGDVKGWIDKITLLLNDEKKARSMGAEGRKFVSQNFSWEKIAKDFSGAVKSTY